MPILSDYHKPQSIREALRLLQGGKRRLLPLAGGSRLVGDLETRVRRDVDGVVDISGLGLNKIEVTEGVHVGASVTLSDLMNHPRIAEMAQGVLGRAIRGEGPVNLRNQATIGGLIASAEPDSETYAALLALAATVTIHDGEGEQQYALADFAPPQRPDKHFLITQISLEPFSGSGGLARVARTPSDRPIVAAVAVSDHNADERVALCGVAPWPILDGQVAPAFSDFKGSVEYRQAMASVVKERSLREAKEG